MEYIKLVLGIGLIIVFTWIILKNRKRSSFIIALSLFDTMVGIIAGFYLVITSMHSLIF